jgi:hypothetical protein
LSLKGTLAGAVLSKGVHMPSKHKKKASNVERLESAGVLISKQFTEGDKKTVEKLTEAEVSALTKMRKKRGPAPKRKYHLRPNIFI